jgi:sugar lactone lactonase YvrE
MKADYRKLEVVTATRDRLGESPLWSVAEERLHWVDFFGPTLRTLASGASAPVSHDLGPGGTIGSIALLARGRLLLALDAGLVLLDPSSGLKTPFADPNEGRAGVGYNDAKVDRQGRLWIGTYDTAEAAPRGVLYRVERTGRAALADSGFVVCNGPAFSPDGGILYFSDTAGRKLLAYDIEVGTGRLLNRRLLADLSSHAGIPDGLCTDSAGGLWCAHYGEGRLVRFRPDGTTDRTIDLPVRNVASCCLGGRQLRTLFIVTGEDPRSSGGLDGALFAIDVDVPGLPEPVFDPVLPDA